MALCSVADVIEQALTECTQNSAFIFRVLNGSVHEDEILAGFLVSAEKAGVPLRMIDLVASNYPLSERDSVGQWRQSYKYRQCFFLETEESLLRLDMDKSKNRLVPRRYSSRAAALLAMGSPEYFQWDESGVSPIPENEKELLEALGENHLVEEMMAAHLAGEAPLAQGSRPRPRL